MLLNSSQGISYLGIKLYNQKSIIETPQETIDNIVMQNEQFKPTLFNRYFIYTYRQIIILASIGSSKCLQKPSASRLNEEIWKTKQEKLTFSG